MDRPRRIREDISMIAKHLRFRDLKALGIVSNWTTVQRWIESEGFPPGRRLGPNTRTWTADEISQWLDNRPAATGSAA